jgi:quinone-modifying oxidoreductase subunit QmoC
MAGVIFTGALIQFLRLAQSVPWMYVFYFVHLVLIFALFVSAPYTKFAHVAYRTVAMAAAGRK